MGNNHRRRGIPKKAFTEIRGVLLDVLTEICRLDDEGVKAWNDLVDTVFHYLFTKLDEKKPGA